MRNNLRLGPVFWAFSAHELSLLFYIEMENPVGRQSDSKGPSQSSVGGYHLDEMATIGMSESLAAPITADAATENSLK